VRARYAQGLGTQSDAIRAELEQTRLDPELSALERDEEAAKAKINALIGRSADAALAPPRELRMLPPTGSLKLDGLMGRARESNPLLATARAEIEAAEGERRLVDKSWYPDVTLTLGANDLADIGSRVTGTVGIKVPLQWGVREAQAREATAKKGAAQLRQEAAALKIESELQSALASLGRAQRTEDLLQHGLVSRAMPPTSRRSLPISKGSAARSARSARCKPTSGASSSSTPNSRAGSKSFTSMRPARRCGAVSR
jgi:outer membrane protein, heavy metal efflux system